MRTGANWEGREIVVCLASFCFSCFSPLLLSSHTPRHTSTVSARRREGETKGSIRCACAECPPPSSPPSSHTFTSLAWFASAPLLPLHSLLQPIVATDRSSSERGQLLTDTTHACAAVTLLETRLLLLLLAPLPARRRPLAAAPGPPPPRWPSARRTSRNHCSTECVGIDSSRAALTSHPFLPPSHCLHLMAVRLLGLLLL